MKLSNNLSNLEIADLLRNVSSAYEIKDAQKNKFKIIAYDRAATAVEHLSSEAKDLWDEGKLSEVGGIGESITSHLGEIFTTGKSKHFDELLKGIPEAVFELIRLPGIGAKTAVKLSTTLGIKDRSNAFRKLKEAIKKGKVSKIEGFGEKSEKEIADAIDLELRKKGEKRMLLPYAHELAKEILEWMRKDTNIASVDTLGSLRRMVSTIGDIDIAASSKDPEHSLKHFTQYPKTRKVIELGNATAGILLPNNVQVDIMVQKPEIYGSVLQHFTGSKHHNIALREFALKKNFSLSEYGVKNKKSGKSFKFSTEKEFYNYLGLDFIPPELREDSGEINASTIKDNGNTSELPNLVTLMEIKADLQIHSDFNIETSHDLGQSSMEDIVKKADSLGYIYIALTEHNPSHSRHSENQIIDILKRKKEAVEKLNYSFVKSKCKRVRKVFNSLEIDILLDGRLPISEKALELLDFALVSIHSSFMMNKKDMTKRIVSALNMPNVKIFAHPTARKLNDRESIEIDWDEIFDVCKRSNIWLEINADPARLDLPDFLVREAVRNNIMLTLGTDSHHIDHMDNMRWGVYVARRGWAEKSNIVNCMGLEDFEKSLN